MTLPAASYTFVVMPLPRRPLAAFCPVPTQFYGIEAPAFNSPTSKRVAAIVRMRAACTTPEE